MKKYLRFFFIAVFSVLLTVSASSQQIKSGTYMVTGPTFNITLTDLSTVSISYSKAIRDLINALNTYGVQSGGTVEFDFDQGYVEIADTMYTIGQSGSALFTTVYSGVIFKKINPGTNPVLIASTKGTSASSTDFIIRILGADNITFDGIDVKESSSATANTSMEFGYYILNSGGNGAQNNTIKNCRVSMLHYGADASRINYGSIGVYQNNTDNTTTNSNNVYDHITVDSAYKAGIKLSGYIAVGKEDTGCQVKNCVIGSATGSIGGSAQYGSTGLTVSGLYIEYQKNFSIHDDTIKNVQYFRPGNSQVCYGAYLSNVTGTISFYKNWIYNISNRSSASSTSAETAGLRVDATSGTSMDVYNNFFAGIESYATSNSSTFTLFGIKITGAGNFNIYFNSIYLPPSGTIAKASSAALDVPSGTTVTLNVKNNILKNASTASGSSKIYCFYFGSGTLSSSDYNIFDITTPAGIYFIGNYLGTNEQTFATWKSATGKDANSPTPFTAAFLTTTDLHLTITSPTATYNGISIASPSITTDIDNDTRVYPMIGADEVNFLTPQVRISNNNPSDSNVARGTTQPLAGLALQVMGVANHITRINFTTAGSYLTTDFKNLRLVYSTTNSWTAAVAVPSSNTFASVPAVAADNLNFTFPSLNLPIGPMYFFVLFDIASAGPPAVAGDNIRVGTLDSTKVYLDAGTKKIGDVPTVPQGGLQTVVDVFYNWGDSDLVNHIVYIDSTAGWYSSVSPFNPPTNFTDPNQQFVFIHNNSLMSGNGPNWRVSGANSKIIVGDPTKTASVTFVATDTISTNGTTTTIDVKSGGYFKIQTDTIPALLTMYTGSTVDFGAVAKPQTIPALNYYNLTLSGSGARNFSYGTTGVAGAFIPNSYTSTGSNKGTISFNGTTIPQTVPGNFTYWRLKVANSTATPTITAGDLGVDSLLTVSNNFTISSGDTLSLNTAATVAALVDTLLVNGAITNNNPSITAFAGTTTSTLLFGAGANYNLNALLTGANYGQIPAATWDATSSIYITNVTNPSNNVVVGLPSGLGFGNISFNAPALATASYRLLDNFPQIGVGSVGNPYVVTIQGNLILGQTNSQTVDIQTDNGASNNLIINIGGNLIQNSGIYRLSNASTVTANITGTATFNNASNFTMAGAGVANLFVGGDINLNGTSLVNLSTSTSKGTIKAGGNFTAASGTTVTETGTATGNEIQFTKNGTQIFTNSGATFANDIYYTVKSTSITQLGASSSVVVNSGAKISLETGGKLDINGGIVTINGNDSSGVGYLGVYKGSATSDMNIAGTGALDTLYFDQTTAGTTNKINNFTLSRSTTGTATLGNDLVVGGPLAFSNGAALVINGTTLTLNGNVTYGAGSGSLTGSAISNLTIGNTGAINPTLNFTTIDTASRTLKDLVLNASAKALLGTELYITAGSTPGSVTVAGGSILTTANLLTLRSNIFGTSRVGVSAGLIQGKVTVERYIPGHRAWRLLTAPIKSSDTLTINTAWQESVVDPTLSDADPVNPHPFYGTHITGGPTRNVPGVGNTGNNGYDAGPNTASIFGYSGTAFSILPLTTRIPVRGQEGWMVFVRGSRSTDLRLGSAAPVTPTILRPKGDVLVGTTTVIIPTAGFKLIGNPYPSTINYYKVYHNAVNAGGKFSKYYYAWSPQLTGSNGVGAFVTFIETGVQTYSAVPDPGGFIDKDGSIQSGQAFVIYDSTSNVTISEADKTSGSDNLIFSRPSGPTAAIEQFRTNLHAINADGTISLSDGTLNLFDSSYMNSVNLLEDAKKIGNFAENLALLRDSTLLSVEKRQPVHIGDTIFYNMTRMRTKSYKLEFIAENMDRPNLAAFLEDSYTATRTPVSLNDTTIVDMTIDGSEGSLAVNRFRVVFTLPEGGPLPVTYSSIKAWQQNHDIAVEWKVENELNINHYEVEKSTDGRNFIRVSTTSASGNNASNIYNWVDTHPADGVNYYRIRSIDNNGIVKYSQVVLVKTGKGAAGIAVYPNPVKDNIVGLQLNNMAEGVYQVRLLNTIGQVLQTNRIDHMGGSSAQTINLGKILAKGIYQLEVIHPDNRKTNIKLLTQ